MKKTIVRFLCAALLLLAAFEYKTELTNVVAPYFPLIGQYTAEIADDAAFSVILKHQAFYVSSHQKFAIAAQINSSNDREVTVQYSGSADIIVSLLAGRLIIETQEIDFEDTIITVVFSDGYQFIDKKIRLVKRPDQAPSSHTTASSSQAAQMVAPMIDSGIDAQLRGSVYFERLLFDEYTNAGKTTYRLMLNTPHTYAARFIKLNLRNEQGKWLATTYTNHLGEYDFSLSINGSSARVYIEIVATMAIPIKGGGHVLVQVKNHAKSPTKTDRHRVYRAHSSYLTLGAGEHVQDIYLTTGWHPSLKEFISRDSEAQPFAMLDTLAKGFIFLKKHGVPLSNELETLTVLWSQDPQAADKRGGYFSDNSNLIFINGSNGVSDDEKPITTISEWNEHTILHEFGHYYLAKIIGRDDSTGGAHNGFGFVGLSVSLSEGLATAISRTVLQDWQIKRAPLDIDSSRIVDNTVAITQAVHSTQMRYLLDVTGHRFGRPTYSFSPFIEESSSFFISSLIDENAEYSERTTKLARDVGMFKLHQALVRAAQAPELLTLYSLAQQLKILLPEQSYYIDDLGVSLNIDFVDGWGEAQSIIESHIVGFDDQLLDERAQYPLYSELFVGEEQLLNFNGALQSVAGRRPGTLRYAKLSPLNDGNVVIFAADVVDDEDHRHRFNFDVLLRGKIIGRSRLADKIPYSYLRLMLSRDETYVLRLFDSSYLDPEYKSNETISSNIIIQQR
ncbi:MAG: hypothetical protein HRU25_01135 [Psychrobium sp.]|nr:hypothetical protein [Psychrobium sp.]